MMGTALWAQGPFGIVHYQQLNALHPNGAEAVWVAPLPSESPAWFSTAIFGDRLAESEPRGFVAVLAPTGNYTELGLSYGGDGNSHWYGGLIAIHPLRGLLWGFSYQAQQTSADLSSHYQTGWNYLWRKDLNQQIVLSYQEGHFEFKTGWQLSKSLHPAWSIEFLSELGWNSGGIDDAPLSMGFALGVGEAAPLELRAKVYHEPSGLGVENWRWSAGLQLLRWHGSHEISLNYVFSGMDVKGTGEASHGVGIRFSLGAENDIEAPLVVLRLITPRVDAMSLSGKPLQFVLDAKDDSGKINQWVLVVSEIQKEGDVKGLIYSQRGEGKPPRFIEWNGELSTREVLKPGLYGVRLMLTDQQGNSNATEWQYLEID